MATTADYQGYANAIAQSYGLNPSVFNWQLGQESSWNPNAVGQTFMAGGSPTQAVGIAQFIPSTASQFGIDPTDPFQSISAAGQYDAQLLSASGGNYYAMLNQYGTIGATSSTNTLMAAAQAVTGTAFPMDPTTGQPMSPQQIQDMATGKTSAPGGSGFWSGLWDGLWSGVSSSVSSYATDVVFLLLGLICIAIGGMILAKGNNYDFGAVIE